MNSLQLLNDSDMQEFIRRGYVTVEADMPAGFHEEVYRRTDEVLAEYGGNPGNNILPMVPDLQRVLDHPRVRGVLASILGPDCHLHAHRFCHNRAPHTAAQQLHKDNWGRRHHRARWCMAFYYPQDTTLEMGPTGVVPGSQYYNNQPDAEVGEEIALCGAAGTVTVVHYDLWHRALENSCDRLRFMHKFLFTRMTEPTAPTWNSTEVRWLQSEDRRDVMWQTMWDWSTGGGGNDSIGASADVDDLLAKLEDDNETTCFQAAYGLGAIGETAVPGLAAGLSSGSEDVRRCAGYGLSAVGGTAVPALEEAARSDRTETRAAAADALGNMGRAASSAITTLEKALRDDDGTVRTNAAYAFSNIGVAAATAIPGLIDALDDAEEWVVRNASLALAKLGPEAAEAVPRLAPHLHHENRYVQANTALALKRIGTQEATEVLLDYLTTSRWCPVTTKDTPF